MNVITYNIQLDMTQRSIDFWTHFLFQAQQAYNDCANFLADNNIKLDIKTVHNEVYEWMRTKYSVLPAQAIIRTYKEVIAALRSIKANKYKDAKIPQRHNLAMRLDKRLYDKLNKNGIALTGEQKGKRTHVGFIAYPQVEKMFNSYVPKDPLLFIRNGRVFLSVPFEAPEHPITNDISIGVDMGVKRLFVTSEGNAFKDTQYLSERRKIRYFKSKLQEKKSRSAKRHLKKLRRRERHLSNDMCHRATNTLLNSTDASIIVLEDLSKIKQSTSKTKDGYKRKKHNNMLSQVPFYQFKEMLTYKAQLRGKRVETVSPTYTSQTDSRSNKRDGIRQGCRYICSDGIVLDADWNASVNIAKRGNHPTSIVLPIDGGLTTLVGREQSTSQSSQLLSS